MKKLFTLLAFVTVTVLWAQAAEDPSVTQYTGRYKFSDASDMPVAEVTFNDKGLQLTSSMGVATLQHLGGDTFSIVEFNGTAEFVRSSDKKVKKVVIKMMTFELEGSKEPAKRSLMFHPLAPQKFLGDNNYEG
jgi:hypothetical protein